MQLSGEATRVRKGDCIQWDKNAGSIIITRGGRPLLWTFGTGTDDKLYMPAIKHFVQFEDFVRMLGQVIGQTPVAEKSMSTPTFVFN